jgi:predicted  nucleic acid-binding Zn-ribbon protein
MNPSDSLQLGLKRLAAALDQLEAAAERRAQADAQRGNLEEELAVMQDDRTKLAVELDGVVARTNALENANQDVARRLELAGQAIRTVLAKAGQEQA